MIVRTPVMCVKKRFFPKSNVKQHDQRVHGEVRLFKCDLCNKSFAFEQDLKHHSVTVFLKFARRFFKLTEKELARVSHALSHGIFYV